MDRRIALLREFYRGLPKDRAKVETRRYGFAFLDELLSDGVTLEYGELTLTGLLHKYKLANIPEHRLDGLFRSHVAKESNFASILATARATSSASTSTTITRRTTRS